MTSVSHYVWIYGLAEALAVSLAVATLFGIGWWRLRQDRKRLERTCKTIGEALQQDILGIDNRATARPELRKARLVYLKALARPFNPSLTQPH